MAYLLDNRRRDFVKHVVGVTATKYFNRGLLLGLVIGYVLSSILQ